MREQYPWWGGPQILYFPWGGAAKPVGAMPSYRCAHAAASLLHPLQMQSPVRSLSGWGGRQPLSKQATTAGDRRRAGGGLPRAKLLYAVLSNRSRGPRFKALPDKPIFCWSFKPCTCHLKSSADVSAESINRSFCDGAQGRKGTEDGASRVGGWSISCCATNLHGRGGTEKPCSAASPSSHGPAAVRSVPAVVSLTHAWSFLSRGRRKLADRSRWRAGLQVLPLVQERHVERKKCSYHLPSP